jgi:hypothetical protein
MANVHTLTIEPGGLFLLVSHVAIPVGNNSAGLSWQTARLRSGASTATVLPDGDGTLGTISASEKSDLVAGTIFEVTSQFDVGADWESLTGPQKAARVDAEYTRLVGVTQAALQQRLRYFGFTRG